MRKEERTAKPRMNCRQSLDFDVMQLLVCGRQFHSWLSVPFFLSCHAQDDREDGVLHLVKLFSYVCFCFPFCFWLCLKGFRCV